MLKILSQTSSCTFKNHLLVMHMLTEKHEYAHTLWCFTRLSESACISADYNNRIWRIAFHLSEEQLSTGPSLQEGEEGDGC